MGAWVSQSWCMNVYNLSLNETCKTRKRKVIYDGNNWQLVFSCDKMRWFKTDGEILKFRHLLSWHGISMVGAKLSSFTLLFNLFKMAGKTSRQRPPARWGRRENWWLGGMGKWYPSVSWCHRSSHKRGYPVCGLTSRNEDTPPWADVINRNTPICGLTSWKGDTSYVRWRHEREIPLCGLTSWKRIHPL